MGVTSDKFNINGQLQEGLSIEHIMPQSWMPFWPLKSGAFAPADVELVTDEALRLEIKQRDALIHSLPNLTLLTPPANSQIGNGDFSKKRIRLNDSLLKTNVVIAAEIKWDEDAIQRRSDRVIDLALRLWPYPAAFEGAHVDSL